MHEAKSNLSRLVKRAAAGEEITIAKHGKPVALLTRLPRKAKKIPWGVFKGKIRRWPKTSMLRWRCSRTICVNGSFLLDTNVLIWLLVADKRMSARAKRALERPGTRWWSASSACGRSLLKVSGSQASNLSKPLDGVAGLKFSYHSPWTILPLMPEHCYVC